MGHSAAGRAKSMKNLKDPIGNRNRDLPTCSAVPQPTALPPTPSVRYYRQINVLYLFSEKNMQKLYQFIKKLSHYRSGHALRAPGG
jgi:hypothetical protein